MRHQSVVLLEQGAQTHCVHIEGSHSTGRAAAFLNETKARLTLAGLKTSLSIHENTKKFHEVFTDVVNEYYDHYLVDEQGHAKIALYTDGMTAIGSKIGENYFGVENDFSCEAIDRVFFTDKEKTHYEILTDFYAKNPKMSA